MEPTSPRVSITWQRVSAPIALSDDQFASIDAQARGPREAQGAEQRE
jgi:hypothetical protein